MPNRPQRGRGVSSLLARALPYLLIAPIALPIIVLVFGPMVIQVYDSFATREQGEYAFRIVARFTLDNYAQIIEKQEVIASLIWTVGISLVVAFGTIVVGLPIAQYLARGTGRGKLFVEMALLLPLFGDVFIAYALLYAMAPQGIVNWALTGMGLIKDPIYLSGTPAFAVVAMMLPGLAVLLMRSALVGVDPVYEEAAQMLGANPARAWYGTTFALARVGIAGAFLLSFAGAMGAYTIPAVLSGKSNPWYSTLIQNVVGFDNVPLASAMSITLTILTAGVIYMYIRLSRPRLQEQS